MLAIAQPDVMIDYGMYGPLAVRAVSVRGSGHRAEGTPRQDDFCLGVGGPANEFLIAIVADGTSAAPRSHVASRAAARHGVRLLASRLSTHPPQEVDWNELIGGVAAFVLAKARSETGNEELDPQAASTVMATTIAFAVVPVYPDGTGVRRCTVLAIGDTSARVLRTDGTWEPAAAFGTGEGIGGGAGIPALPLLPPAPLQAATVDLQGRDVLFVLTDGVGDPLGDGRGEMGGALARFWAAPPDRYAFAAQVDFHLRSFNDDRSVIGIWPDQVPVRAHIDAGVTSAEAFGAGQVPETSSNAEQDHPDEEFDPLHPIEPVEAVGEPIPGDVESPVISEWTPTPWSPTPWKPS